MPLKGGTKMGRGGSSGGRVSGADRARVVPAGRGGFALRGTGPRAGRTASRTFATRQEAEREARDRRVSSSRAGIRAERQRQDERIRNRFSARRGGG